MAAHRTRDLVQRPRSLAWLNRWKDRDVIKVVTGLRRCGKSTLLELFQTHLAETGVPASNIIAFDLEKMGFDAPATARELYNLAASRLQPGQNYVFLDEVQRVPEFERAVDALYAQDGVDVYITGSNSDLLSSQLGTLLTGRYVELRLLPLSFAEYCSASAEHEDPDRLFNRYLVYGGLPYTTALPAGDVAGYLDGVLSTVLVKDVSRRHPRFNMALVERLAAFMADNVGNPFSLASIAQGLSKSGQKISPTTVGEYLDALVECYVLFEAKPYDLKGKALLERGRKYYLGDLGFRHLLLGRDQSDLGRRVENVVYLELLRRYRKVFVGKVGRLEVDFAAESEQGTAYFQVALSALDEATLERELAPLRGIGNNYPKTLLSLDRIGIGDYGGIAHKNLIDWLLEEA